MGWVLDGPVVRAHQWIWNPNGNMAFGQPFESVDELGDKPLGWVPSFPLGTMQREFAETHNLPLKATLGGKENLCPEYMEKIKEFAKEEAAEKEAAKLTAAAKKPAAKK